MYKVKFFKDNDRDMIELAVVGDPNTVIRKVQQVDRVAFPKEWDAYQAGGGSVNWGGTPLTQLVADPETGQKVASGFATSLAAKGVHNVEMLASLSDQAAMSLGMGVVTLRTRARAHLGQQETSALAAVVAAQQAPQAVEIEATFDDADIAPVDDGDETEVISGPDEFGDTVSVTKTRRRKAS
jgi:hypothetical protein